VRLVKLQSKLSCCDGPVIVYGMAFSNGCFRFGSKHSTHDPNLLPDGISAPSQRRPCWHFNRRPNHGRLRRHRQRTSPCPIDAKTAPGARFDNLPGYDYAPHYVDDLPGYEGLRVHYVEKARRTASAPIRLPASRPGPTSTARLIPVFLDSGARGHRNRLARLRSVRQAGRERSYTFSFHSQ